MNILSPLGLFLLSFFVPAKHATTLRWIAGIWAGVIAAMLAWLYWDAKKKAKRN